MADDLLYHYTSVQALVEIATSFRFRLGNVFFMNDYMEGEWLWGQIRAEMDRRGQHGTRNDFEYLGLLRGTIGDGGFAHVYCGCFSVLDDDLSQWRGYADDGRGIAIGVNLDHIVNVNGSPGIVQIEKLQVIYDSAEQMRLVNTTLDSFGQNARKADEEHGNRKAAVPTIVSETWETYQELARYAAFCKNSAFEKEQEVRLVLLAPPHRRPDMKPFYDPSKELPCGVEYWHRGGRIVPYAPIDFPLAAIRDIRLGPKFGGQMEITALQCFLSKQGVEDSVLENMRRSTASYR